MRLDQSNDQEIINTRELEMVNIQETVASERRYLS